MPPLTPEEQARWDSYLPYEDQRVLSNIPGITSYEAWKQAEYSHAEDQLVDIASGAIEIPATFDVDHAKAVHQALFDGFYEWAGECRQVPLSDGLIDFAPYDEIASMLAEAGSYFKQHLEAGGDRDAFIAAACEATARWNYAHPFREGNGRTMKVVLDQFAESTPWQFKFDRVTPGQWNTASMLSMPAPDTQWQPQPQNLHAVFNRITVDRAELSSGGSGDGRGARLEKLRAADPQAAATIEQAFKNHVDGIYRRAGHTPPDAAASRYRPPPQRSTDQGIER